MNRLRTRSRAGGGGFNPLTLFAAGEQGVWYDPSDFSTMFQDSAGTTPVTATGQPVGKILDKSGRGNHATQATAAARPTVEVDASGFHYLSFDGVDNGLVTGNIDFSGTAKATVFAGVRKLSDAGAGMLVELTATTATTNGGFYLGAPDRASASYGVALRGTVTVASGITATSFGAPITNVVSCQYDTGAATTALQLLPRVNGVASFTADGAATTAGNFANAVIYIGRRAGTSLPFNGRLYSLIVRGAITSASDVERAERYVGSRAGVTL